MSAATEVFHRLPALLAEHQVEPVGVLHVGAHRGQEAPYYMGAGFGLIRLVEPIAEHAEYLRSQDVKTVDVIEAAVRLLAGTTKLFVTGRFDEASSVYRPLSREVTESRRVVAVTVRDVQHGCNVLVLDCQGAELEALQSADLGRFDLIIVETFPTRRYERAAVRGEIEQHMARAGWTGVAEFPHKVETVVDLVYVKERRPDEHGAPV